MRVTSCQPSAYGHFAAVYGEKISTIWVFSVFSKNKKGKLCSPALRLAASAAKRRAKISLNLTLARIVVFFTLSCLLLYPVNNYDRV